MVTEEKRTSKEFLASIEKVIHDAWHRIMTDGDTKLGEMDFEHLDIYSWPQMWGSTSCGFGIGGSALTTAQTTVIDWQSTFYVYHAGRYAYTVTRPSEAFVNDWKNQRLLGAGDKWRERYVDDWNPNG